jgi:methylated-DNA-[protein]-cysteine S-methyltransferase
VTITIRAEYGASGELVCTGVFFGKKQIADPEFPNDSGLAGYAAMIHRFLNGDTCPLNTITIQLNTFTEFQIKVLTTARTIPRGETVSYKKLALLSGYPRAVRAVAHVMRNNRFPLIIPCHRVVKNDGAIGGFAGKRDGVMIEMKKRLLEHEGVRIENGKLFINH